MNLEAIEKTAEMFKQYGIYKDIMDLCDYVRRLEAEAEANNEACGKFMDEVGELRGEVRRLESKVRSHKEDLDYVFDTRKRLVDHAIRLYKKDNERYKKALDEISNWRQEAHEYDDDMDHEPREFCEDVELIEKVARNAIERDKDERSKKSGWS